MSTLLCRCIEWTENWRDMAIDREFTIVGMNWFYYVNIIFGMVQWAFMRTQIFSATWFRDHQQPAGKLGFFSTAPYQCTIVHASLLRQIISEKVGERLKVQFPNYKIDKIRDCPNLGQTTSGQQLLCQPWPPQPSPDASDQVAENSNFGWFSDLSKDFDPNGPHWSTSTWAEMN